MSAQHLIPNSVVFSTNESTEIPKETNVLLWMTPDPLPELPEYLGILICPYVRAINSVPENVYLLVTDLYTAIACQLPPRCKLLRNGLSSYDFSVETFYFDKENIVRHTL